MVEFTLPDVGEGMHEGEILRLLVKEGDVVAQDQPLLEVQTDKVNAELSSPVAGRIRQICCAEGEMVQVGATLLVIEENVGGIADPTELKQTGAAQGKRRALATPYVRQLARELGINIELITGTGAAGRVTEEDVRRFAVKAVPPRAKTVTRDNVVTSWETAVAPQDKAAPETAVTPPNKSVTLSNKWVTSPDTAVTPQDIAVTPSDTRFTAQEKSVMPPTAAVKSPVGSGGKPAEREERIPLKGVRKRIAEHLVRSVSTIPHVTSFDELEMDELQGLRERLKPYAERRGIKLTYLPFFIKALVVALREFPVLNASLDDKTGEIVLKKYYHIGIATDTPEGLIVPVIKEADRKSMFQLAEEISQLADLARNGKLTLQQITGGTFTISNAGSIGGLQATPIIHYPEAAILSLHKMEKRMVVRNDEGVIRNMMNMSLSFDHRIIDGVTAVRFTNRIRELLESPHRLFAEMM